LELLVADGTQPSIARAAGLSLLAEIAAAPSDTVRSAAKDDSPLVRRAAAHALSNSDMGKNIAIPSLLLNDPIRTVRIETAEVLGGISADGFSPGFSAALHRATEEYIAAQELNAARPEAHLNLGLLFTRQGKFDRSEAELKTALSLDPAFSPAAVNLADLYRGLGRDAAGEAILRSALARSPATPRCFMRSDC
jgi:tetratricopeptide (TPR) repeat protein